MIMKIGNTNISDVKIGNTNINKVHIGTSLALERAPIALLPQTQAIIDVAISNGYTLPSSMVIYAMNTLIGSMIDSGYWDKQDVIFHWIYNDANLHDFGMINWKNPTGIEGSSVGTPLEMNAYGFKGDNTNYFTTNFIPSVNGVNYQLNDASRTFLIHEANHVGNGVEGNESAGYHNGTNQSNSSIQRINSLENMAGGNLNMNAVGMKLINRISNSNIRLYTADAFHDRTQTAHSSLPVDVQNVFKNRGMLSLSRLSMYAMGGAVTDTQLINLKDSYNTYISTIGLTPFA